MMDDLTVMKSFRAERVKQNPTARAAARRALEAHFDSAWEAGAPSVPARPSHLLFRRRRFLAFAGAAAGAAIVAGVLVLNSGPTAQPASAAILRHTAAVAAAAETKSQSTPGLGQFLYMKTESLELQGWDHELTVGGGILKQKGAFSALIRWHEEAWLSRKDRGRLGRGRQRSVMATPRFLSSAEQDRWERAGSPLPAGFNGKSGGEPGVHVIEVRRGVRDVEDLDGAGFGDFSSLPTEPRALRLAIEHRQVSDHSSESGSAPKSIEVIVELWDILERPNTTPALRAAVFNALAEVPGIKLNRNAKDLLGRPGYALSYEITGSRRSGEQRPGIRVEYIFDPETSAILGKREVITDPEELPSLQGVPAGTVRRETAYLESGIVDSTHETPAEAEAGRPAATNSGATGSGAAGQGSRHGR
jgi:hypothetical protein